MTKLSTKQRILNYLTRTDKKNTMTSVQAVKWFGESARKRIHDLRKSGYPILTIERTAKDGTRSFVYAMDAGYFKKAA